MSASAALIFAAYRVCVYVFVKVVYNPAAVPMVSGGVGEAECLRQVVVNAKRFNGANGRAWYGAEERARVRQKCGMVGIRGVCEREMEEAGQGNKRQKSFPPLQ